MVSTIPWYRLIAREGHRTRVSFYAFESAGGLGRSGLSCSLTKHRDRLVMANLNCQVLATRGAQPNVFKHTGFVWLCFGLNQIQLAFAEITKRIATPWIRALR